MRAQHRIPHNSHVSLSQHGMAATAGTVRERRHREGAKAMDGNDRVEVSKGGLALAQHIAPVYFDNPKVRVVMVGGSVSRGCADQYSDLDIGVFWAEPRPTRSASS
jgi:hypothetical protein